MAVQITSYSRRGSGESLDQNKLRDRGFHWGVRCLQWAVYARSRIVTPYSFTLIHFFPSSNILGESWRVILFVQPQWGWTYTGNSRQWFSVHCLWPNRTVPQKLTAFVSMLGPNTDLTATYRGLFFLRVTPPSDVEENILVQKTRTGRAPSTWKDKH